MPPNRPIRRDACDFAVLFVAALVPWLFVVWRSHAAAALVVGVCVATALAVSGTMLSRAIARPERHIPARGSMRKARGQMLHAA